MSKNNSEKDIISFIYRQYYKSLRWFWTKEENTFTLQDYFSFILKDAAWIIFLISSDYMYYMYYIYLLYIIYIMYYYIALIYISPLYIYIYIALLNLKNFKLYFI